MAIESRMSTWFECKVKYEKMMEDGLQKMVSEPYVVDAFSFTEAEARITEELSSYISGEFTVTDIKKASYKELVFVDGTEDIRWFKTKLEYITLDEKSGKEKRAGVWYLVEASNLPEAVRNITQMMSQGVVTDYIISSVAETKIMDVFEKGLTLNAQKPAPAEAENLPQ